MPQNMRMTGMMSVNAESTKAAIIRMKTSAIGRPVTTPWVVLKIAWAT